MLYDIVFAKITLVLRKAIVKTIWYLFIQTSFKIFWQIRGSIDLSIIDFVKTMSLFVAGVMFASFMNDRNFYASKVLLTSWNKNSTFVNTQQHQHLIWKFYKVCQNLMMPSSCPDFFSISDLEILSELNCLFRLLHSIIIYAKNEFQNFC